MNEQELIRVVNLFKHYPVRHALLERTRERGSAVKAVNHVSFSIRRGEVLGLVGESGSGKTTTGMCLSLLERPTGGKIFFEGADLLELRGQELFRFRRRVQVVFQDPYQSLDPRFRILDTVMEPLTVHNLGKNAKERRQSGIEMLRQVGLQPELAQRYPHELSGGQRQRVAVARAMILRPDFVVADEPVSMLDVSVRAGVLKMMLRLRRAGHLAILFITHDLAVARYMCDRIAVLYLGQIVEIGLRDQVLREPVHPYTKALIAAVPVDRPDEPSREVQIKGEIASAIHDYPGCAFEPRCAFSHEGCKDEPPPLVEIDDEHFAACRIARRARSHQPS